VNKNGIFNKNIRNNKSTTLQSVKQLNLFSIYYMIGSELGTGKTGLNRLRSRGEPEGLSLFMLLF
jgi:hypothetical protein